MEWMRRMNEAVSYVEAHLKTEIDYGEIARIAGCSAYHFQRVFAYMAGVSLAEYLRRRRLTLAAFELQRTNRKVIDIALESGYESPTAFARAFQNFHGMSPSEARAGGGAYTAFSPISFQISIKGVSAMQYRIEEKKALRIVGAKLSTTMENDEGPRRIPAFWQETAQSGMIARLGQLCNGEIPGALGVSVGNWKTYKEFDYYIGFTTAQPAGEGMEEYLVPACTWAIFEGTGPMPGAMQELQSRIVSEWLPTSGYEYADAPDIEVYFDEAMGNPNAKFAVWLPIKEK